MSETAKRVDHFATFQFKVDLGGKPVATFSECAGLEMSVKFEEVREGGQNEYVHRLPGRVEYGNLVLKRGYAEDNDFFKWCISCFNRQKIERRNVTVTLVSQDHTANIFAWTFVEAYPVKWSGPSFKAGDNAIVIESVELAHRGLQIL
jgi:phage tail-like protein